MKKSELEQYLKDLRILWVEMPDWRVDLALAAEEINRYLESVKIWCYQCREYQATFNGFYCSKECNDLYYPPKEATKLNDKIAGLQMRLGNANLDR